MNEPRAQRWLLFMVGGVINTGFTYIVYLGINYFLSYQVSYLIAYATGVLFSYWFNARVVFRVPLSWEGLFSYPLIYATQYFCTAFFLGGLVEVFNMSEMVAPLIASITMIPITYLMSKTILSGWARKRQRPLQGGSAHE